jgi:hypothetical protein
MALFLPQLCTVYTEHTRKSLSTSNSFNHLGGRIMAEARSEKIKKQNRHIYDDQTIENMIRYYKVEENFDTFLRYIKSRSLQEDVL